MVRHKPIDESFLGSIIVALLAGIMAGCASPQPLENSHSVWVEPDWFAQAREERDAIANWSRECLTQYGGTAQNHIASGLPFNSDVETTEEEHAAITEAIESGVHPMEVCFRSFLDSDAFPSFWNQLDEASYQRMLDTRECVIQHGYAIPEAPSFERWVATFGQWGAFGFINSEISFDEAVELNYACPQAFPSLFEWE